MIGPQGQHLPLKSDPLAFAAEMRPKTASIVLDETRLPQPRPAPSASIRRSAPISIYEVHLGSWRRKGNNEWLTYRELAEQLPAYARDLGFTHIEFLPVSEHPFDGSWGYQPTGLFAPTSRFGSPADFAALVDACHAQGLGVHPRLGARTFPRRSARPRPLRRHRALRACQSACRAAISTGAR